MQQKSALMEVDEDLEYFRNVILIKDGSNFRWTHLDFMHKKQEVHSFT